MNRSGKFLSVRGVGRLILLGACFAVFLAWLVSPDVVDAGRHRAVEFLRIDGFGIERTLLGSSAAVADTVGIEGENGTGDRPASAWKRWSSTNL